MGKDIHIRAVTPADAPALLHIYAPYVTDTAITFEYDVPTIEDFTQRITTTLEKYPYLLAEQDGDILGYVYAGPFHARPAYNWAVETSIYVSKVHERQGIGRVLYGALEQALKAQGILNANACIAYPIVEDEYLTRNSVDFHARMGYAWIGEFHQCGYKFNRWYNMVWMEKLIGDHKDKQEPVKPFKEIDKKAYQI